MLTKPPIPTIAEEISREIVTLFGARLDAVLLYGSSRVNETFWDLDMVVLIKEKTSPLDDLSDLQTIQQKYSEQTLDLQLFYPEESSFPDLFSLDAHGAFFIHILAEATPLYGKNPFAKDAPREDVVITSLINRIQRYVFQARQEYLGGGRHNKDRNPEYHAKHIERVMLDLLLLIGEDLSKITANTSDISKVFRRCFPDVLNEEDWRILTERTPDDIAIFMALYEKIYTVALFSAQSMLPGTSRSPSRMTYKGIVCEYLLPEKPTSTAIIVLDGLPRKPELSEFLAVLASWGYAAFFPRLTGTWESAGVFLDHDPTRDVIDLAHGLKDGIALHDTNMAAYDKVVVIGASFGGLVALCAGFDEAIAHVIALSPPLRMSDVPKVETLFAYLETTFPMAYRCTTTDWEKLLTGKWLDLSRFMDDKSINAKKYSIVTGTYDKTIPPDTTTTFCASTGIRLEEIPTGHLSLHKDRRLVRPRLRALLSEIG